MWARKKIAGGAVDGKKEVRKGAPTKQAPLTRDAGSEEEKSWAARAAHQMREAELEERGELEEGAEKKGGGGFQGKGKRKGGKKGEEALEEKKKGGGEKKGEDQGGEWRGEGHYQAE